MYPLDPKQIQLIQQAASYDRTARYGQEVADMIKDAGFDGRAAIAARPKRESANRLGLRALVGRLARRALAQA